MGVNFLMERMSVRSIHFDDILKIMGVNFVIQELIGILGISFESILIDCWYLQYYTYGLF